MPNTTPMPGNPDGAFSIEAIAQLPVAEFSGAYLGPIEDELHYEQSKNLLLKLILESEDMPDNPLNGIIHVLGLLIEQYEETNFPIPAPSPIEVLRYLMEQHTLTQSDLPEVGSQGVVSEILRGRRQLNTRQIQALSQRFHISPALFFSSQSEGTATAG